MDGRPHGIQMTPTGGDLNTRRTLCWQGTHRCSAFFCARTRFSAKTSTSVLVRGSMGDGWLRNPKDGWTYRFQRDEKSWLRDPFVFVDKGRAMPDGSPALLKTRQYLRRKIAEGMWKELVRKGWKKVPAVWGVDAEP